MCWTIAHVFSKVFLRLRIEGYRNVPMQDAVILASNHISFLDPPIVAVSTPRPLSFMAKRELFEIPILGGLITRLHSVPVDRAGGDRKALKSVLEILRREEAVLVFPEGTRSRDGQLHSPKNGVGLIAANSHKPILPVYVQGTVRVRRNLIGRQRAVVRFGKAFRIEELPLTNDRRANYRLISEAVMERIRKLRDGENNY